MDTKKNCSLLWLLRQNVDFQIADRQNFDFQIADRQNFDFQIVDSKI
jgi:hypothetical protein